tara:strand:- start:187 stop:690 length:504 start_codon:yes stop_codon:yes gene_type:complete
MAEIVNTSRIGQHLVRPTEYAEDEQLWNLARYDKALGNAGHDRMHFAPASFFVWDIQLQMQVAISSTEDSLPFVAPWPFTIWAADLGVEVAATANATGDIFVDPVGAGAAATILDAPEALAAGTVVRVAPEVGLEDVDAGDAIFMRCVKDVTDAGDGYMAKLYCQRR